MFTTLDRHENKLILFFISTLSILWFIWLYKKGLALSPDSTNYLNYSIYIKNSLDFSYISTVWPPAYPTLIAIAQFFTDTPSNAATLVSGVMLFLALYFTNKLMKAVEINFIIRIFSITILFLNTKFLFIFQYAWSESTFTAFYLGAVYFLVKHYNEEKTKYLIFASILVSAAALSRYLGYSMIILMLLYTAFYQANKKELFNKSALINFAIACSSGFLSFLWMIRNYFTDKTLHGPRNPSPYKLEENIILFKNILINDNKLIIATIAILLPLISYSFYTQSKNKNIQHTKATLMIFSAAFSIYIALTIYSATTAHFDMLNTRFFAPAYPIIIFIFALSIKLVADTFFNKKNELKNIFVISFIWVFFIANLKINEPMLYFKKKLNPSMPVEIGFNRSKLKKLTINWLNQNLTKNKSNDLLVLADYSRSENARIPISRGLLLRSLDKEAKNYKYNGNGADLTVSFELNQEVYTINYLSINSVNHEFEEKLFNEGTLALVDSKRYKQLTSKKYIAECKVQKLHTLYGINCSTK